MPGRRLQLLVREERASAERRLTGEPGGAWKFMVCIYFLAPELYAPESRGPGIFRLQAGAAELPPDVVQEAELSVWTHPL